MKLAPIVNHLQRYLPYVTDAFSDMLSINSINIDSQGLVTVETTTDHGLSNNQAVVLRGIESRLIIDTSLTEIDGNTVTFYTKDQHNLTELVNFKTGQSIDTKGEVIAVVELSNFDDPFYDGLHKIKSIPSGYDKQQGRHKFLVEFENTPPPITASQPLSFDGHLTGVGGYHEISVIDSKTFTYQIANLAMNNIVLAGDNIKVHKKVRVGAVSTSDMVSKVYTKQPGEDIWAFITDASDRVSSQREMATDSETQQGKNQSYNLLIIAEFSIILIKNSSSEISSYLANDAMEDYKKAIINTLAGVQADNPIGDGNSYLINYLGSDTFIDNGSVYAIVTNWQTSYDIIASDTWRSKQITTIKRVDEAFSNGLTANTNI